MGGRHGPFENDVQALYEAASMFVMRHVESMKDLMACGIDDVLPIHVAFDFVNKRKDCRRSHSSGDQQKSVKT